jgi:hypothetical protein
MIKKVFKIILFLLSFLFLIVFHGNFLFEKYQFFFLLVVLFIFDIDNLKVGLIAVSLGLLYILGINIYLPLGIVILVCLISDYVFSKFVTLFDRNILRGVIIYVVLLIYSALTFGIGIFEIIIFTLINILLQRVYFKLND